MNLLEQKSELINEVFLITKEALGFLSDESFDDFDDINEMMDDRKGLMAQIDEIDSQMKQEGINPDDDIESKRSIEITLHGIISMDGSIAELTEKFMEKAAADLKNVRAERKGVDITKEVDDYAGMHLDISK